MPGIGAVINYLATDVNSRLTTAGYAPLNGQTTGDGVILIGRQHVAEQSAPPRIVVVPMASTFGPRDTYNRNQTANFGSPSQEQLLQWAQRSIHTEILHLEIHVWGAANPPDPEGGDFDATQVYYQCLIQSVRANITGGYTLEPGIWVDQDPKMAQLMKFGHEFVFGINIHTPILDMLLSYAPSGTVLSTTVEYGGDSSEGIVIVDTPGGSA
jgi:hypothetical protein